MKSPKRWFYLVLLLMIASLVLVACERPLPGGYNDPEAGTDTTVPEVPQVVPEVDSSYPAESEAPVEAAPADTEAYPVEDMQSDDAYPAADEAGEAVEEAAPEAQEEQTEEAEAAPEDAAVEEAGAAAEEEAAAQEGEEETVELPGTHTVAAGENLFRIGMLYGVSWLDLAAANNIDDPANLTVGQVLIIPGSEDAAAETAADEAAGEETAQSDASEEVVESEAAEEPAAADEETDAAAEEGTEERPDTYVVQAGDNLYRIGLSLGVDWNEIVAANGIVNNQIVPGQVLIIPYPDSAEDADVESAEDSESAEETDAEPADETQTEEAGESYVVQEGDSIYKVAFIHNIPWTLLVEANGLAAPYTLEVGQTLVIPAAE